MGTCNSEFCQLLYVGVFSTFDYSIPVIMFLSCMVDFFFLTGYHLSVNETCHMFWQITFRNKCTFLFVVVLDADNELIVCHQLHGSSNLIAASCVWLMTLLHETKPPLLMVTIIISNHERVWITPGSSSLTVTGLEDFFSRDRRADVQLHCLPPLADLWRCDSQRMLHRNSHSSSTLPFMQTNIIWGAALRA